MSRWRARRIDFECRDNMPANTTAYCLLIAYWSYNPVQSFDERDAKNHVMQTTTPTTMMAAKPAVAIPPPPPVLLLLLLQPNSITTTTIITLSAVVDLQGSKSARNNFVAMEIAILANNYNIDTTICLWIFEPPHRTSTLAWVRSKSARRRGSQGIITCGR